MSSRVKETAINSGSINRIYNSWETFNDEERERSLNNFAIKLDTSDIKYQQSVKHEYLILLRDRPDEKMVSISFRILMVMFSSGNSNAHANMFLEEFIGFLGNSRNITGAFEHVKCFFKSMFHLKELRDLFFKHVRSCCRKKMLTELLTLFDELVLNIVKQAGLLNIFNTIGTEESLKICNWYFDLAPDFYPWVEYERFEKRFTFEYHGNCITQVDGFTDQIGHIRKTMTHDHGRYKGRTENVYISYGHGYQPIEIEVIEPSIKSRNSRIDLCALREFLERDFWELKRFLNYNTSTQYTNYKFNSTFTSKDYELFFFPQNMYIH